MSSYEEYEKFLSSYEQERNSLLKEITTICWNMRGGVTYEQAWELCYLERKAMFKLIEDNVERTKKSGLPLL